jgi:hypothetical protein
MKTKKLLILIAIVTALSGCWDKEEQKLDCKNPRNTQEKDECANKAFSEQRVINGPHKTY